jgi:GNAT superfamily N-acetyltransferase
MIRIFTMTDADCERTAAFIRDRVMEGRYAERIDGLVSGESLRAFPELQIELAENDGKLVGYLLWQTTYSTWRGLKGIYINDHYATNGNSEILSALLNHAIGRGLALGAAYIRTEADITEEHLTDVYAQANFWQVIRRTQYYLEAQAFSAYVQKTQIAPLA